MRAAALQAEIDEDGPAAGALHGGRRWPRALALLHGCARH